MQVVVQFKSHETWPASSSGKGLQSIYNSYVQCTCITNRLQRISIQLRYMALIGWLSSGFTQHTFTVHVCWRHFELAYLLFRFVSVQQNSVSVWVLSFTCMYIHVHVYIHCVCIYMYMYTCIMPCDGCTYKYMYMYVYMYVMAWK